MLTKNEIERITETAVKVAFEYMAKERARQQKEKKDRRLRNTRLLLRNYRSFKNHCDYVKEKLEKLSDPEFLEEMDGEEFAIDSIKKSKERTLEIVRFIDQMIEVYRIMSESSDKPLEARYFQTMHATYISDEELSAEKIAEKNDIDVRTVYRDLKEAAKRMSSLIFGVDGIRMIG